MATPSRPLDGITVVSLEQAIAAPFCTRQLADLGARVIKIERPGTGDFARGYDRTVNGQASHFVWINRTKESLTLDLKRPEAADVLTRLIHGEEAGEKLSEAELLQNCVFILNAGHETTTNLIGNSVVALTRHPDKRRLLVEDPDLAANTVEELLRYDSPVQRTSRVVTSPIRLDGIEAARRILDFFYPLPNQSALAAGGSGIAHDARRDLKLIGFVDAPHAGGTLVAVTFLTAPEPREKLINFYRKVRPEGPGWKQVAADAGLPTSGGLLPQLVNWVLGCVLIYTSLFGIGKLVLQEWMAGVIFIAIAIVAGVLISRNLSRVGWKSEVTKEPKLEYVS